jgi:hypothetical protein
MVRRRVGEGEAGGVDGGQERRIAPVAGAPDVQQRRAEEGRGARKKKGVRTEPGTDLQYQRKTGI